MILRAALSDDGDLSSATTILEEALSLQGTPLPLALEQAAAGSSDDVNAIVPAAELSIVRVAMQ